MKSYVKLLISITATLLVIAGCEYDGPTAMYDRPYEETESPVITSVDPPEALAGVNYITIEGEHFSSVLDSNKVYIDGFMAEITDYTRSSITIRRPDCTGDSTAVKVVNYESIGHAAYWPYKIVPVFTQYGGFIENTQLMTLTVGSDETVYAAQRSKEIYRITADGEKEMIGESTKRLTDMKMAPDGQLVLLCNDDNIYKFNIETRRDTIWIPETILTEKVSFGDFSSDGNLYAGGKKSGVVVIKPDMSVSVLNIYSSDEICCMRVFEDALYLLVDAARPNEDTPDLAIWRHSIQDDGTLGEQELVVDWAVFGANEEAVPVCFTFSKAGILYLSCNDLQPVYSYDMNLQAGDILYKEILPAGGYCLTWGSGDYMYMIQGEDVEGNEINDLIRIDMGEEGATYYGR